MPACFSTDIAENTGSLERESVALPGPRSIRRD
jgi:hypothetical protein